MSADALEVALLQVNADRCVPPLEKDEVKRIAKNAQNWEAPKPEPVAILGKPTSETPAEPVDWRTHYHTFEEMENASARLIPD